jgi:23S rRNA (guanosine2251-2'-O)-methyltransferase
MSFPYCDIQDILDKAQAKQEVPFILLLDNIEDPRNFGAIARTAEAVGVHGIIIPKRRSVSVTETVEKTSTGAINLILVAQVGNINEAIKKLKVENIWVTGLEADGDQDFKSVDYKMPTALVIGSEGNGLSRLTRENCDHVVSIPMRGEINSLNASVAAAVAMYEILRQRG